MMDGLKKVIITGSTGFIGTWLADEMVNHGIEVIALVRKIEEKQQQGNVRTIEYDSEAYKELLKGQEEIDVFYHLAWGGVSTTDKNNSELQLENIQFSIRMLEDANQMKVKKFIGIGTVAEYSFCENIMDVNAKQTPNDMYGAAKTATHYLMETRARILGMSFVWTVLPSTFGEGRKDNNIITYTIMKLLKGEKPQYGYLLQMWDFLYVAEVVRALRYIGTSGKAGTTYAIGSGSFRPLKDYIMKIRDIINPEAELGIGEIPTLSDKTFSSCVSIYDLTKDTGYLPKVSFEEGIEKTIAYYKMKHEGEM